MEVRCEFFVKDSMLNHTLNDKQKEMMGLHFEEKMDKYRQEENIPYYVGTMTYLDGRVEKKRPYRIWS